MPPPAAKAAGPAPRQASEEAPAGGAARSGMEEHAAGGRAGLPEGFFDDAKKDRKARGVAEPKLNPKEEWKDFQQSIQGDVEDVDAREDEEEAEAADEREGREKLVQSSLLQRLEELRRRKEERRAEAAAARERAGFGELAKGAEDGEEEEEGEEEGEEGEEDGLFLDWRQKHI
eukprot:SM001912S04890  [mRNA]  locus=s1912:641:1637:- [translate_table: standard]